MQVTIFMLSQLRSCLVIVGLLDICEIFILGPKRQNCVHVRPGSRRKRKTARENPVSLVLLTRSAALGAV